MLVLDHDAPEKDVFLMITLGVLVESYISVVGKLRSLLDTNKLNLEIDTSPLVVSCVTLHFSFSFISLVALRDGYVLIRIRLKEIWHPN